MIGRKREGLRRLSLAILMPWFIYWGWRLFAVLQDIWFAEPYRNIPDFGYNSLEAERDKILVIALGTPAAIVALIVVTRWVMAGFASETTPPNDPPGL